MEGYIHPPLIKYWNGQPLLGYLKGEIRYVGNHTEVYWDLRPYDNDPLPHWLFCYYRNTLARLVRSLPKTIHECATSGISGDARTTPTRNVECR